jgi:hypothetical protein
MEEPARRARITRELRLLRHQLELEGRQTLERAHGRLAGRLGREMIAALGTDATAAKKRGAEQRARRAAYIQLAPRRAAVHAEIEARLEWERKRLTAIYAPPDTPEGQEARKRLDAKAAAKAAERERRLQAAQERADRRKARALAGEADLRRRRAERSGNAELRAGREARHAALEATRNSPQATEAELSHLLDEDAEDRLESVAAASIGYRAD